MNPENLTIPEAEALYSEDERIDLSRVDAHELLDVYRREVAKAVEFAEEVAGEPCLFYSTKQGRAGCMPPHRSTIDDTKRVCLGCWSRSTLARLGGKA